MKEPAGERIARCPGTQRLLAPKNRSGRVRRLPRFSRQRAFKLLKAYYADIYVDGEPRSNTSGSTRRSVILRCRPTP